MCRMWAVPVWIVALMVGCGSGNGGTEIGDVSGEQSSMKDGSGTEDGLGTEDRREPDDGVDVADFLADAAEMDSWADTWDWEAGDVGTGDLEVTSELPDPCEGAGPDDSDGDGLSDYDECVRGTDPLHPDTDRDGVWDGDELTAGTDPLDPSSAEAWQPHLAQVRPRLFFSAEDLPGLRQRWLDTVVKSVDDNPSLTTGFVPTPTVANATIDHRPSTILKSRIQNQCNAPIPAHPADGSFDVGASRQQAWIASACAFQGLLEQRADPLIRSAQILQAEFPDPSYLGVGLIYPADHYNLLESEALALYCSAYDYLLGAADLLEPELLVRVRERLLQRLAVFRELMHKDAFFLINVTSQNNHTLKVFGALGLCAMSLNDHPLAAPDMNEAVGGMTHTFAVHQSVPEGGYGEGWTYLTYGGESFLPFLVAHHRFAQGNDLPYKSPGLLTDEDPLANQVHWYQDFAVHPVFRSVYEKALWSTAPDGRMVNTDDANHGVLHGAVLAWLFDDPRFLWNWFQPAVNLYSGLMHELSFVLYDEATEPAEPDWPLDVALPEAGFAILRSGFGPDDLMLVVQAEHGTVNAAGGGHEHPEPTSFLLHAYGEYLVMDPGYIDWTHNHLVKFGEDHNVILVDGKGPEMLMGYLSQTEGWITDLQVTDDLASVTVKTQYRGVQFARQIQRKYGEYFVVQDRLTAPVPHSYAFQLNGPGCGGAKEATSPQVTSCFELQPDGAVWHRPKASLYVWTFATQGQAQTSWRPEEHAAGHGQWEYHAMFTSTAEMGSDTGFLSIVIPVPAGEEPPMVERLDSLDGTVRCRVNWRGRSDVVEWAAEP